MKRVIAFTKRYVYAAASCLYLFTVGFFFVRNRSLISTICSHFGYVGYVEKSINAIVPKVKLSKIVSGNVPIQICEPIGVEGNVSLLELFVILQLIKLHNPGKLFEIGTFDGRTTLNMASNCSHEAKVYTLDLPKDKLYSTKLPIVPGDKGDKMFIDKEISGSRYLGKDCERKIIQLYGDSATFDFSPFLNMIDFIFIDGSHSYEYLLNDSKQVLKLLRNGKGVMLWHDYDVWEGVTRALNKLYLQDRQFKGLKHIEGTSMVCLILN